MSDQSKEERMSEEALETSAEAAGDTGDYEVVVKLIKEVPDETIWKIVQNWPTRFDAKRAKALGFAAEENFDDIVHAHIEDELGGKIGGH